MDITELDITAEHMRGLRQLYVQVGDGPVAVYCNGGMKSSRITSFAVQLDDSTTAQRALGEAQVDALISRTPSGSHTLGGDVKAIWAETHEALVAAVAR